MKSDQQLRKTIDDLRELERKCCASRSRFAFYDYLAAVFELYVQLKRTKQANPIRVIIDATSTADLKTRSRWSRALRYAWYELRTSTDFVAFLRENGGPAGCARQFAAITKKDRRYIVYRYAGTGRPYLIVHKSA